MLSVYVFTWLRYSQGQAKNYRFTKISEYSIQRLFGTHKFEIWRIFIYANSLFFTTTQIVDRVSPAKNYHPRFFNIVAWQEVYTCIEINLVKNVDWWGHQFGHVTFFENFCKVYTRHGTKVMNSSIVPFINGYHCPKNQANTMYES